VNIERIFLLLLAGHTVFAVVTNQRKGAEQNKTVRLAHILLQGPILWLAFYFGACQGVFSRQLVSPVHIGLGLVAGHVIFALSLLATQHRVSDIKTLLREEGFVLYDVGALWDFAVASPVVLVRFIRVGFAEELIWRVVAQTLAIQALGDCGASAAAATWAGILGVAVAFSVAHKKVFTDSLPVAVEFIAFAILLGVLYHWTGSFILVMIIHALRDIEVTHLEYLAKVEELGDETRAAQEIEQAYLPRRPEQT
jgi:membrane protease YdiL (CAAX protease family)